MISRGVCEVGSSEIDFEEKEYGLKVKM